MKCNLSEFYEMEVGSYMTNSNLRTFDNFYANLAQSA